MPTPPTTLRVVYRCFDCGHEGTLEIPDAKLASDGRHSFKCDGCGKAGKVIQEREAVQLAQFERRGVERQ